MSMSKTGKKLKSVDCDNIDLTFNEIYDVFIDSEEYEFIIDDIGDKRYVYVHDKDCYELVDDVDLDKEWFMSDCTKSNCTKTGKKVKCVYIGRIDLIYKKVYDVFIDVNGDEFVIDEVGDWRYDSMEFPLWCEVFNDVASATNTANNVSTTNETDDGTKPKFKVGDTVKVTSIEYICQYDKNIKVGDVGVINFVDNDDSSNPYRVKFDETDVWNGWWLTDKCIESVSDDVNNITENTHIKSGCGQIVSDGGSSSYYKQKIPKGMLERFNTTGIIEAKDVIRLFLGNDFNMGNIFKAYCRIISLRNGKGKAGIDEQYDLTKVKYFTEDELNYYLENNND